MSMANNVPAIEIKEAMVGKLGFDEGPEAKLRLG